MVGEKRATVDPVTAAKNVRRPERTATAKRKSGGMSDTAACYIGASQTSRPLHDRPGEQTSAAMRLLNPPPHDSARWRGNIQNTLALLDDLERKAGDELDEGLRSKQGKAALDRYISDLRKLKASHAALNRSIQRFLLLKPSVIESDIIEAEAMRVWFKPGPRKRPVNKRTRAAVGFARFYLEERGCELTTAREGKWHELAKVLADTDRDLRHYMAASLAEKRKK
jgi:hypothetical protein